MNTKKVDISADNRRFCHCEEVTGVTDVAIQLLACDNPKIPTGMFLPIGHTNPSKQCDSGTVKMPAEILAFRSAVRNDEKDVSKVTRRKSAFTLAEGATHVDNCANIRKSAFTLAEVLITLGVIGIVAAMTLPALIQKNNNKVVEIRLKKFYSAMNQAILMAENDYGDKKDWYRNVANTSQKDEDGNFVQGSNEFENWFNTYLAQYLNIIETETLSNGTYIVYFSDGGALQASSTTTRDWWFYPGKPKKCIKKYNHMDRIGVCMFLFNFYPNEKGNGWQHHYNKGIEPYKYEWGGNVEELFSKNTWGCNKTAKRYYCTAVIQMNNWTIPDDYPLKVSY